MRINKGVHRGDGRLDAKRCESDTQPSLASSSSVSSSSSALRSKFKVPAFLGSSFAFLGGFATIANMDSGVFADMSNADKLSYACGGIVVAGLLYLILALT